MQEYELDAWNAFSMPKDETEVMGKFLTLPEIDTKLHAHLEQEGTSHGEHCLSARTLEILCQQFSNVRSLPASSILDSARRQSLTPRKALKPESVTSAAYFSKVASINCKHENGQNSSHEDFNVEEKKQNIGAGKVLVETINQRDSNSSGLTDMQQKTRPIKSDLTPCVRGAGHKMYITVCLKESKGRIVLELYNRGNELLTLEDNSDNQSLQSLPDYSNNHASKDCKSFVSDDHDSQSDCTESRDSQSRVDKSQLPGCQQIKFVKDESNDADEAEEGFLGYQFSKGHRDYLREMREQREFRERDAYLTYALQQLRNEEILHSKHITLQT